MAADAEIVSEVLNHALTGFANAYQRRERFADGDSEERLNEVREQAATRRQGYQHMSNLVMVECASVLSGSDNKAAEEILLQRSVSGQPGQQTYNDPNYRSGSSAPPGTPAQKVA